MSLAAAALMLASGTPPIGVPPIALPEVPDVAVARQDSGPKIYLSADGTTVYLIGELVEGSFLKFDAVMLDAPRVKRIYLASIGGMAVEGRLIAALVRKRRLDTYVEYYCASACTMIFVGGRERVIGREAQLGFHQAVVVDKNGNARRVRQASDRKLSPTMVFGVNGNDSLRLNYEQAGIDPTFIGKVLDTRHSDMWIPTLAELTAARVITRQAARTEVLLPAGGMSKTLVLARLGESALWREAAHRAPAEWRKASNDVWLWANSGMAPDAAIRSARSGLISALNPRLLTASDAQLDALLAFHARNARRQREAGYPLCTATPKSETPASARLRNELDREEDALLVTILASPPAVKPPGREQAMDQFAQDVMPAFARAYRRGDTDDAAGTCRYTYRTYEEVASLPLDKRAAAYRAMLALPDFLKN